MLLDGSLLLSFLPELFLGSCVWNSCNSVSQNLGVRRNLLNFFFGCWDCHYLWLACFYLQHCSQLVRLRRCRCARVLMLLLSRPTDLQRVVECCRVFVFLCSMSSLFSTHLHSNCFSEVIHLLLAAPLCAIVSCWFLPMFQSLSKTAFTHQSISPSFDHCLKAAFVRSHSTTSRATLALSAPRFGPTTCHEGTASDLASLEGKSNQMAKVWRPQITNLSSLDRQKFHQFIECVPHVWDAVFDCFFWNFKITKNWDVHNNNRLIILGGEPKIISLRMRG